MLRYRAQEWLADRFRRVQYPRPVAVRRAAVRAPWEIRLLAGIVAAITLSAAAVGLGLLVFAAVEVVRYG